MASGHATVGVDLGGTKILAAAVVDGEVVASSKRSTPRNGGPEDVLARVVDAVERLGLDVPIGQLGVGGPGRVDPRGRLGPAPNLPGWSEPVDVAGALRVRFPEADVRVDNDVNVAALAEWRNGAGRGEPDLLAVFVGTGVGGGLVLDRRLRRGPSGLAGEIGHLVVVPDGEECGCGGRGHLEAYAGRAGIERIARRRHAAGESTRLVELAGDGRMKSSVVEAALADGDPMAVELVEQAARMLGQAVATVSLVVDVELVAVGGGVAERLGDDLLRSIEGSARAALPWPTSLRVVPTRLGDTAGALGAALLFDEATAGGAAG